MTVLLTNVWTKITILNQIFISDLDVVKTMLVYKNRDHISKLILALAAKLFDFDSHFFRNIADGEKSNIR